MEDFYDARLEGYQLVGLVKLLSTHNSNPDEGYTYEDSTKLMESSRICIDSIKNMIRLLKNLTLIDFNHKSGFEFNSKTYFKSVFHDISENCKKLDSLGRDLVFYATYLSTMVVELLDNPLGDDYIHMIIPVIMEQCIKHIKIGYNKIRIQQELVVKKNLEKLWKCPICHENENPEMGNFVWLLSNKKDEKGREACGHKIHAICFDRSLAYDTKCSLCRHEIVDFSTFRISWYRE